MGETDDPFTQLFLSAVDVTNTCRRLTSETYEKQ